MSEIEFHKNIKELILDYLEAKNPLIHFEFHGRDYRNNSFKFSASKDGYKVMYDIAEYTFHEMIGYNPITIEMIKKVLRKAFEENINPELHLELPPKYFVTDLGKKILDDMHNAMKWELAKNFLENRKAY